MLWIVAVGLMVGVLIEWGMTTTTFFVIVAILAAGSALQTICNQRRRNAH